MRIRIVKISDKYNPDFQGLRLTSEIATDTHLAFPNTQTIYLWQKKMVIPSTQKQLTYDRKRCWYPYLIYDPRRFWYHHPKPSDIWSKKLMKLSPYTIWHMTEEDANTHNQNHANTITQYHLTYDWGRYWYLHPHSNLHINIEDHHPKPS